MADNIRQFGKNIANLDKDDTYSLMLLLLYASSDNPKYSTLNELAYILDHDNFLKFIKYYEGMTIEIPTIEDIKSSLRLLMLFQYTEIEKLSWQEALEKAGFSEDDSHGIKRKFKRFKSQIEENKYRLGGIIGGRDNKS